MILGMDRAVQTQKLQMTKDDLNYGVELAEKTLSFAIFVNGKATNFECKVAIETLFGKEVAEKLYSNLIKN